MASLSQSPVLAIVGPTASGKSDLALFLAGRFNGEIVNCDSVQVYRELNIGSAKTPESGRHGIPHHLVDVVTFTQELTAGGYARRARAAITGIRERGRLPIVVGGTGFYLRALLEGLSPAPARSQTLRNRLEEAERRRKGVLHRLLRRIDRASARRIHPNDVQKLIRAIEISCVASQPASVIQDAPRDAFDSIQTLKIGLCPNRPDLVDRINQRTEEMFRLGLVDETKALLEQLQGQPIPRSLLSLGYRQAVDFLQQRSTLEQAIEQTKIKTRQYVKRQLTWFRADLSVRWIDDFGFRQSSYQVALECATRFLGATSHQPN